MAYFTGLCFGDGSVTYRKGTDRIRFQLRGDATEEREFYEDTVIPLCNELIGLPFFGREVNTIHDVKRNCFGVSVESPKIKPLFDEIDYPIGRKEDLTIPEWVREELTTLKAFVRGLFDTDGHISYYEPNTSSSTLPSVGRASIASKFSSLVEDLSEAFIRLDIKHHTRFFTRHGRKYWRIEVFKPHVRDFWGEIQPLNTKHTTKFEIWREHGFCPTGISLDERRMILNGYADPYEIQAGVG